MREYGIDKLERQPVVHSPYWINPASDTSPGGPAQAFVLVVVGTPQQGDVPFYDATLGYFVLGQVTVIAPAETMLIYDEVTDELIVMLDADGEPYEGYPE